MNVLLVVLDSVRARNVSAYGYENETTPYLDELAAEGTLYEQARAPGSWSLPSHTSLFTGLHAAEHRVLEPHHRLEPGHTVFEDLRASHETGVFSENPWVTVMDVGLNRGFDHTVGPQNVPFPEAEDPTEFTAVEGQGNYGEYLRRCVESDQPVRSVLNGVYTKLAWDHPNLLPESWRTVADAGTYVDAFLDWQADRGGDWAACVNLMDGHAPYEPAPEHDLWGGPELRSLQDDLDKHVWSFHGGDRPWWECRAYDALYDGAVHQMDAELRRLVETLRDRGALDDTLLVVTADHGEGFGEPSRLKPDYRVVGHVDGVHEVLLHVPLVVRPPGSGGGERVSHPASITEFPRAVEAALGGGDPSFRSEGPVVASAYGLTEPNTRLAERYCEERDLDVFRGEHRVAYERADDGAVVKHAAWADEAVSVRCVDPATSYVTGGEARDRVEAAFADLRDAGVRAEGSGVEDASAEVRRHLRDLGYAE